ncbi:hypothetical protein H0H87_012886, partial [Tephrocybe sp. NHM501043]
SSKKRKGNSKAKAVFDQQWLKTSKAQITREVAATMAEAEQDNNSLVAMDSLVLNDEDDKVEKKAVKIILKDAVKKAPGVYL